jgi:hypothetical protein
MHAATLERHLVRSQGESTIHGRCYQLQPSERNKETDALCETQTNTLQIPLSYYTLLQLPLFSVSFFFSELHICINHIKPIMFTSYVFSPQTIVDKKVGIGLAFLIGGSMGQSVDGLKSYFSLISVSAAIMAVKIHLGHQTHCYIFFFFFFFFFLNI